MHHYVGIMQLLFLSFILSKEAAQQLMGIKGARNY